MDVEDDEMDPLGFGNPPPFRGGGQRRSEALVTSLRELSQPWGAASYTAEAGVGVDVMVSGFLGG